MVDQTPVAVSEREVAGGRVVGHAQLQVENTLNSLSLEMTRLLMAAYQDWSSREEVVGIVITGAGDKAFCAGGDIQALYRAICENHAAQSRVNDYPFRFFEEEYRLDYALRTAAKPVLTIGHGIVMGGGLGILGSSRFRVLTERSRLALPEITIGLFPDAGGTWTLGQMDPHIASFLGLTGSHANAADSLTCGMGTHLIAHAAREQLLADLYALPWSDQPEDNNAMIAECLGRQPQPALPAGELANVAERTPVFGDFAGEIAAVRALAGASDWVDRGIANLNNGCPTTAGIVVEQLRRVAELSMADAYRLELTVATHCAQNDDFMEGVRALLIDKDNQPKWRFGSLENLQWAHVLSHFEAPWATHPLADLG